MKRKDELEDFPLYQKALEIFKLTRGLIEIVPEDNEFLQETTVKFMMEDAMIIPAKIAGAHGIGLYDLKMENAAIIRKAARELMVRAGSLEYEDDIKDKEYITLLRNTIEEFRFLFIDWVASFDTWDYIIDRWGLFNPPGVTAHDKDPDDDIPFNPKDFFEGLEDFDDEEE
ncbi:hypothetical protein [Flavobacterium tibetense]|uniref:Uncharacterized protein n=1 Tax=Flavobacterium tibetense TaxID=2233533 RepID=A0A365NZD4_9FLAO|nr:hypothetical protein [Flavobacterium tibetense]RBA27626.1 hypothetical protein DPN68_11175 [Flavobacterium tibetense]